MPETSNNYVFCADFSSMAACLFAIANQESAGLYDDDQVLLDMLDRLQNDLLKKLYNRVLRVLGTIDGAIDIGSIGPGDFDAIDFSAMDFQTGYIDNSNGGYSSRFQTILNIFAVFCSRKNELSQSDMDSLAEAFFPVWDAFNDLQDYLTTAGLNPCQNAGSGYFNNASEIRLQAAGSDGSQGIQEGVLLRWLLNGELGDQHLPQGNYANPLPTHTGFNRPDDYVHILKTPYSNPVSITIDFSAVKPAVNYPKKKWSYIINLTRDGITFTSILDLVFKDWTAYLQVTKQFNPNTNPVDFLKNYVGIVDIAVQQKTFFKFALDLGKNQGVDTTLVKVEALSIPGDGTTGELAVMRDNIALSTTTLYKEYYGENMHTVRIKQSGHSYLHNFTFETYNDFLNSRSNQIWSPVGAGFGLSLEDDEVLLRLEEPGRLEIDHSWPQYKDGTTVRASNYHDKWINPSPDQPSLKESVADYLSQSQTGTAQITINLSGEDSDPGTSFRYVDLLNIQATDYHFARMLGLGHVDTGAEITAGNKFIYQMIYSNKSSANAASEQFVYLGLPVGTSDLRFPEKPVMRPVSYRLVDDNNPNPGIYDNQGYNLRTRTRLVNIGRSAHEEEINETDFFDPISQVSFSHAVHCTPIMYGIEYRADGQNYVLPYITDHGPSSNDYYAWNETFTGNLRETVAVFDNPVSLYVHFEKHEGIHSYAIYGIDLFSRASILSEEVTTDLTAFPPNNQLIPPTDIAAQYIQQEDTLIFTTVLEQRWLKGRDETFPGADTPFTRVTFNWLDISDVTALENTSPTQLATVIKGNRVKPLFKPGEPLQVSGIIRAMSQVSETQVVLLAGKYSLLDNTEVIPSIDDSNLSKFVGSLLLTPEGQFPVVSAVNIAMGPLLGNALYITVQKMLVTERVDDPNDPTAIGTRSYYIGPVKDSRFTVAESLTATGNWNPVAAEIELLDHSNHNTPVIDVLTDPHGNTTHLWIGGIHAAASVLPAFDTDNVIMPGYFVVTLDPAVVLNSHPQDILPFDPGNPSLNAPGVLHPPYVEWYNGKLFLPLEDPTDGSNYANDPTSGRKLLDVVRVVQDTSLILYVYDAAYNDTPHLKLSAPGQFDLSVNYHPGYRAYLLPEPAPTYALNGTNLLPQGGANDKKSLLALQIWDEGAALGNFSSTISVPAIVFALNIIQPVQPDAPIASILKVRPDATRKAAFTFDIKVGPDTGGAARNPFGWMFYRAYNEQVLHSLYLPATVDAILNELEQRADDPYFADRYLDLLSIQFDQGHYGQFKKYPSWTAENAYGFPIPDLPVVSQDAGGNDYPIGSDQVVANYHQAIYSTIMPLTEQIPVLNYIKTTSKQTENKLPVIRSVDGNLLSPSDEEFDPFPMVRHYTTNEANTFYIRFTDYTLNGSSRFLYFYAAAEVTNRLAIGPLSRFTGPVTILHTLPGEAPVIRSYTTGPRPDGSSQMAVNFNLSPFVSDDTITHARIYRTADLVNAEQLSTMDSSLDVDLLVQSDSGITVTDDFSDLTLQPLGETVYYRIVFIREIINEFEETELVTSLGSDVIAVKLIDMFNPDAPEITYHSDTAKLIWDATANKATYYVYKQNAKGNWQQVAKVLSGQALEYPVGPLPHQDSDGNTLYYRYKIKAENSSGLMSLADNEITISPLPGAANDSYPHTYPYSYNN